MRLSIKFILVFVSLYLVLIAIILANPLNSSADEQAQTIKSVAAARLQFKGFRTNARGYSAGGVPVYFYKLPHYYETISPSYKMLVCELGYPDQSVCHNKKMGMGYLGYSSSYVGSYEPIYNFVVGLPSLVFNGSTSLYAMQLLSGVFCCAAIALSLCMFFENRRSRAKLLAIIGITPMILYYAAQINPSGLEMSSALLVWCSGLSLVKLINQHDLNKLHQLRNFRHLLWAFWVAVSVLILCRPDSFLIAIAIVGTLLLAFKDKSRKWRSVIRGFKSPLIYVAVFLTAFNLEWIRINPLFIPGTLRGERRYYYGGFLLILKKTYHVQLSRMNFYSQIFNGINYLTTKFPFQYFLLFLVISLFVVATAFTFANKNQRYVIIFMMAMLFITPLIYDQLVYSRLELGFQYRYIIPYEFGLTFLAGEVLDNRVMNMKSDLHSRKRFNLGNIVNSKITVGAVLSVALLGFYETFYFDWRFQSFTKTIVKGKAILKSTWIPPGGLYFDLGFELTAITIFVFILWLVFHTKDYSHSDLRVENINETSK